MILCVLAKPPQLAFILAEALRAPLGALLRNWKRSALVVLPAIVLALAWTWVSAGDVAAWRIVDGTTNAPEHFQPMWKLRFLVQHPWHFATMLGGSAESAGKYWSELIGNLGWLDIPLQAWAYPVLSIFLLLGLYAPLDANTATRRRLAIVSALIIVGYCLAVFMIFYLVWTPIDGSKIEGVQGRYFVVALPFAAVMLSAVIRRAPSARASAWIAAIGSVFSGLATIEAILRSDWLLWLWL
jgi:uncharacterized membrane protein